MTEGGNGRARTFFKQHGWDESGTDKIEAKYTSRAAQLYRRQLEKDAAKFLDQQHDSEGNGVGSPSASDDPWSENYRPKKHSEAKASSNGTRNSLLDTPAAVVVEKPAAPRTTSRPVTTTASSTRPATARRPLGATRKAGGRLGGGLGLKKASQAVDESLFDQAPAEPEEESAPEPAAAAEVEDEFGGPPKARSSRFDMDALEEKVRPAVQRGQDGHLKLSASSDFFDDPFGDRVASGPGSPGSNARGGWGAGSSGRGSVASGTSRGSNAAASSSAAQERFGGAKAISSAAYFNQDGGENDYEKQARLAKFSVRSIVIVVVWQSFSLGFVPSPGLSSVVCGYNASLMPKVTRRSLRAVRWCNLVGRILWARDSGFGRRH